MTTLWGIVGQLEDKTDEELDHAISERRRWIKGVKGGMPYADHGAYGQDYDRILEYRDEIQTLEYVKRKKNFIGPTTP